MFKEFREFINRGNVIDLAVAVVMGAAFSAIVNSLVNDVITPTAGVFTQWLNFRMLSLQVGAVQIAYGNFLQAVTQFLLVAWVVFWLVRMVNTMQKRLLQEQTPAPPQALTDIQLLTEIRDLLKERSPLRLCDIPPDPAQRQSVPVRYDIAPVACDLTEEP
jgi:large conductance mechanosensitive channel